MERRVKLTGRLKSTAGRESAEALAFAAWHQAAGNKIAAHTRATALVHGKLSVAVEDAMWQRQLHVLQDKLLQKLTEILGAGVVDKLEFRPMRAEAFRRAGVPVVPDPPYRSRIGDDAILQAAEDVASEAARIGNPFSRMLHKRLRFG